MSLTESQIKNLVAENFKLLQKIEKLKTEKLKISKELEECNSKYDKNAAMLNVVPLSTNNDDDHYWYGSNVVDDDWASSSWCSY